MDEPDRYYDEQKHKEAFYPFHNELLTILRQENKCPDNNNRTDEDKEKKLGPHGAVIFNHARCNELVFIGLGVGGFIL